MHFAAPWDKNLRRMTAVFLALLALEAFGIITLFNHTLQPREALFYSVMALLFNGSLIFLFSLYAPRGYVVNETYVIVQRKTRPVRIALRRIKSVTRLDKSDFTPSVQIFGTRGLFGYYGIFKNHKLGRYELFGTDCDRGVLVEADRKYVLTPHQPEVFIEVVKSKLKKRGEN